MCHSACRLSSLLLAWLRSRDRLLLWVGIFSVLYAVRLFVQNDLVHAAMNVRGQELAPWALCITYVIPIPYALFARELFGRGWNATIAVWLGLRSPLRSLLSRQPYSPIRGTGPIS